jgi:hypothetical protein
VTKRKYLAEGAMFVLEGSEFKRICKDKSSPSDREPDNQYPTQEEIHSLCKNDGTEDEASRFQTMRNPDNISRK